MKRLLMLLALLPCAVQAQVYCGDYAIDEVVYCPWNTYATDGSSATRDTNGTLSWYENGSTTQSTSGLTDTEDFDGEMGQHLALISATAANGFENGKTYVVKLSGAVVDGVSVGGAVAVFTIGKSLGAANASIAAYDPPTTAELAAGLDALPTAAENATAVGNLIVEPNGSITLKCFAALTLSGTIGPYQSTAASAPFTTTFKDPSGVSTRVVGTVTDTSLQSVAITCP
jgi:hypothetical protein